MPRACQCKSKSIAPRGLDPPCAWDPDVFVPPESGVELAVQVPAGHLTTWATWATWAT